VCDRHRFGNPIIATPGAPSHSWREARHRVKKAVERTIPFGMGARDQYLVYDVVAGRFRACRTTSSLRL
jgi:hypothetical protein